MKTSNEATLSAQTQVILLQGPPGQGKTTFALQFPKPWLANCDDNLAGPVRYLAKHKLYTPFSYDNIFEDDKGVRLSIDLWWPRLRAKTTEAIKHKDIETLVIDSLTQVDNLLTAFILVQQGRKVNGIMEIQYWRPWRAEFHTWIMEMKNSGKRLIVTCHEERQKDKAGNVESYTPTLSTGMKDYLGYYFTDIWRSELRPEAGGKLKHTIKVLPTAQLDLKNSMLLTSRDMDAKPSSVLTCPSDDTLPTLPAEAGRP